eukprot:PITA_36330
MSDRWTDGKNYTIINFLISCPQGTMFLILVDASDKVKDATLLFELLDDIIQEVGEQNVVQVITNNASNYVLARKMLKSKYRTIFWTPCAARCIDLMLEDIGKVEWVKNTIEHAKCITKYIYKHSWVLNPMRKNIGGKELVRPAIMRFATHFLTLQCLNGQHKNLQKMFSSNDWTESRWARRQDGKDTKQKVFDNYFWKRSVELVKITKPLVKVLMMVDGEKLAMGYIYEAMDQAKEQIQETYKDKLAKYGHIWEIIDNRGNNQLHHPIHAVGYVLNPKYHYKAQLGDLWDREVRARLFDCLERMVPSHVDQLEIHRQLIVFSLASGTFGKDGKRSHWWESFGGQCPQLQKFAIRVLSETCSASGDEADLVAASEPGSIAASRKGKEPMEGTSHASRQTRASIRSTTFVIGGIATEVAGQAKASADSKPDDVYVAPDDDPMSSSGDEPDD